MTSPPPQIEKPRNTEKPQQALAEAARQLFDASWYATRYPEAPKDPEQAYRFYLEIGRKKGHHPGPDFENIRCPDGWRVPDSHLFNVSASPILCRVPPAHYLKPYRTKKHLHKHYNTWEDYFRRAMLRPEQMKAPLTDRDVRVIAFMDNTRKRLAADYRSRPQEKLVSIVLHAQSHCGILANVILSVLMQSYQNWELIAVDDSHEFEANEATVKSFGDSRIHYLRLDDAAGVAGSWNAGIERASGHILAYLNDNQWDPDFLLILINQMHDRGAHAAYCAEAHWDSFDPASAMGTFLKFIRFGPYNRSLVENKSTLSITSLIHERTAFNQVGRFDESLPEHTGWDFLLRLTEIETPVAVPCLLNHEFAPAIGAANTDSEDRTSSELRSRLIGRSRWSRSFATADGADHVAFSASGTTLDARRNKLAQLPVETVQILIPNYESLPELEMCLRSIVEHTPAPYEVLVIDNGSGDETYTALEKMISSFETARLIKEAAHSGFSFAVNRGIAEVIEKNQNLLILNNDTLVTPHWLDELRYVLHKHSDVGMAVPRQVLPANSKLTRVHMPDALITHECDINLSSNHENIVDPEFDREDGLVELTYAPLFCGLLRPETLKAAGFLDSANGPHFLSDWILADAIRRFLKQKIVYTPYSKVYHLQGIATQTRDSMEAVSKRRDSAPKSAGIEMP